MIRFKAFKEGDVVHGQYVLLEKIDKIQHSSKIYKGWDRLMKAFVVIKITSHTHKEKNKYVTKILQLLKGGVGIPNIIWRGVEDNQTITVTDCLGPNLKKLFCLMDKQFSITTICMIAIRLLTTLECIHKHGIVCCNIMPKEILISLNKKNQNLFITDFKQAKKVRSGKPLAEVSHGANKLILNKFSSVNVHLGLPPDIKDDLESLGYILIYFLKKGELFEKNSKYSSREEKLKDYETQKLQISPEVFCYGLPSAMIEYLTYIKTYQFSRSTDRPDYEYLRKLFKTLFNKTCLNPDAFEYDWIQLAVSKYDQAAGTGSQILAMDNQIAVFLNGKPIPMSMPDFLESNNSLSNVSSLTRFPGSLVNLGPKDEIKFDALDIKSEEISKNTSVIQEDSEESDFNPDDFDEKIFKRANIGKKDL